LELKVAASRLLESATYKQINELSIRCFRISATAKSEPVHDEFLLTAIIDACGITPWDASLGVGFCPSLRVNSRNIVR
jgi:hypothetical protein